MKNRLKILVLVILIIAVIAGIGFMIVNAVRSISYNKNAQNPVVTLNIEEYGEVKIELYPDYAPNTVTNIVKLIQNGFYDGKVFYGTDGKAVNAGMELKEETVDETTSDEEAEEANENAEESETTITAEEDTLMLSDIDTSVPASSDDGTDTGDKQIAIEGEFVANGYDKNTLRFEYGTVGLYRNDYEGYGTDLSSYSYNSGTSLFFILTEEDSNLNGMYTAFGKVISGMDIIEKINDLPVNEHDHEEEVEEELHIENFVDYPVITTATVETYGVDYGIPNYVDAFDYNSYVSNLLLQYYSTSSN